MTVFTSNDSNDLMMDDRTIMTILDHLKSKLSRSSGPKLITLPLLQSTIQELFVDGNPPNNGTDDDGLSDLDDGNEVHQYPQATHFKHHSTAHKERSWRIVSAFDTPKLVYDAMRQQFRYDDASFSSLLGTTQDLLDMRTQRYTLIRQRVIRFRQKNQLKPLMTIDRLLGSTTATTSHGRGDVPNNENSTMVHILLGLLRSNSGGTSLNMMGCGLELEDLTGSIPLQIDISSIDRGTEIDTLNGIYMEGTTVLVHGSYQDDGVFYCHKIELPPKESPSETKPLLPPLPGGYNILNRGGNDCNTDGRNLPVQIYSMSHLNLDDPDSLKDRLQHMIDGMDYHHNDYKESILVLFGNFKTDATTLSTALEELGKLVEEVVPTKYSVLILPGPNDVAPNACWPIPAFTTRSTPSSLHQLSNVHLCSNPCRLQCSDGSTVLLLRKDLIRESLQHQILLSSQKNEASTNNNKTSSQKGQQSAPLLVERVINHMISQGHVSAATTNHPTYWNYDHSMRLVPLPELMVLGLDAGYDDVQIEN
jgi:DNA polymerase epsilon subunit 2